MENIVTSLLHLSGSYNYICTKKCDTGSASKNELTYVHGKVASLTFTDFYLLLMSY